MPGHGRAGDPLWTAIGFVIGASSGLIFHQWGLASCLGLVLGVTFGLVRADRSRGYQRPADPLWFLIGLAIGLGGGIWMHYLGLSWVMGIGLGLVLGLVLGVVAGTIRADRRRSQERDNQRFR